MSDGFTGKTVLAAGARLAVYEDYFSRMGDGAEAYSFAFANGVISSPVLNCGGYEDRDVGIVAELLDVVPP